MNIGKAYTDSTVRDSRFTTVRLLNPLLIFNTHYAAGSVVTIGKDEAKALKNAGHAELVAFDANAVPPPAKPRPLIMEAEPNVPDIPARQERRRHA